MWNPHGRHFVRWSGVSLGASFLHRVRCQHASLLTIFLFSGSPGQPLGAGWGLIPSGHNADHQHLGLADAVGLWGTFLASRKSHLAQG